jgi:hypothetical protein
MSMAVIDIPTLKQVVSHVVMRKNKPVIIKGRSGIGKSEAIAQEVEAQGAKLVDVRLSHYESVDIHGFPAIDKATGFSRWHPMSTLPFVGNDEFPDDQDIVIFFDEFDHAKPEVLAVCYQIMLDFRVGEFVLKPRVKIVCAMNGNTAKGYGNKLPSPLRNRCTWFELAFSLDAWCAYLTQMGVPPVFIAFHQWKKGALVDTFDPNSSVEVFSTARSWLTAIDYYTDADMPHSLKVASMTGVIGEGNCTELWGFIEVWHKVVKLKDVLNNPTGTPLPDEESMMYATAVSMSHEMNDKTTKAIYTYLKRMSPEYVILAWQLAISRDKKMYNVPEFTQFSQQYKAVFAQ